MINSVSKKKDIHDSPNWDLLNDRPVYISNYSCVGIPTIQLATHWTLEKQDVAFPRKGRNKEENIEV